MWVAIYGTACWTALLLWLQCCVQQSEHPRTFSDWTISLTSFSIVQSANVRGRSLCWMQHRLYGKKRKNALYKYSNNENIPYQLYKYIKNIKMLIKVYINALKRFCIFSNLFDSQRVGTPIINEWTGVAVLCYHGKK